MKKHSNNNTSNMEKKQSRAKNIHDDFFKHNFTDPTVGKAFLMHNLGQNILNKINIETLHIEPNEFLPSNYRTKLKSDVLYSVKGRQGNKLYAFLHLEGQSSHDKHMALRVLEYQVAIAKAHLRRGGKKIPLILSFVLYHGKSKWTSAKSIEELFDDFDLYVDVALKSPFLINLTKAEIDELKRQEAAAAPQLIMKGQGLGDHCGTLEELWPLLKKYDQVDKKNIEYMLTTDGHEEPIFLEKLSKFDPRTANDYKEMFEAAIQRKTKEITKDLTKKHKKETQKVKMEALKEGKLKGLKEGELKGKREGKEEGKREAIESLLKQGLITKDQATKALKELQ